LALTGKVFEKLLYKPDIFLLKQIEVTRMCLIITRTEVYSVASGFLSWRLLYVKSLVL